MAEFEMTERGFKIYGRLTDSKGSEVRVQESSAVGRSQAWIFTEHNIQDWEHPVPHLSVANARELIDILESFIADAEDAANWRNEEGYRETFG